MRLNPFRNPEDNPALRNLRRRKRGLGSLTPTEWGTGIATGGFYNNIKTSEGIAASQRKAELLESHIAHLGEVTKTDKARLELLDTSIKQLSWRTDLAQKNVLKERSLSTMTQMLDRVEAFTNKLVNGLNALMAVKPHLSAAYGDSTLVTGK